MIDTIGWDPSLQRGWSEAPDIGRKDHMTSEDVSLQQTIRRHDLPQARTVAPWSHRVKAKIRHLFERFCNFMGSGDPSMWP